MQSAKQKVSDMASGAKEKAKIYNAHVVEKKEKTMARTTGEKEIAHERMKAKEAAAKMDCHVEKAEHRAQTQNAKMTHGQHGHGHDRAKHGGLMGGGTTAATTGAPLGTNPVLDHHPHHTHNNKLGGLMGGGTTAATGAPLGTNPVLDHHPHHTHNKLGGLMGGGTTAASTTGAPLGTNPVLGHHPRHGHKHH